MSILTDFLKSHIDSELTSLNCGDVVYHVHGGKILKGEITEIGVTITNNPYDTPLEFTYDTIEEFNIPVVDTIMYHSSYHATLEGAKESVKNYYLTRINDHENDIQELWGAISTL